METVPVRFVSELASSSFNIPIGRTRVFSSFLFFLHSCLASVIAVSRISTGHRNKLERMKVVHERSSPSASDVPLPSRIQTWISTFPRKSYTRVLTTRAFFPLSSTVHPRSLSLLHLWREEEIISSALISRRSILNSSFYREK